MTDESVAVRHRGWSLAGTVRVPVSGESPGVAFVHGSGTATKDDWWDWPEKLATLGVATLAYDKPGAGTSGGDWTAQTLDDRAAEAIEALRTLASTDGVDATRIGLLGISQGGWVVPLAAAASSEVRFAICISPAGVSPAEQEEYRVGQELRAAGMEPAVEAALAAFRRRLKLMREGAAAEEIWRVEEGVRDEEWFSFLGGATPERLRFLLRIYDFEPVPILARVRCPLLAIWGDRDILVPVERSVEAFRQVPRAELRVLSGADHELQVAPGVHARGVLEEIAAWIERLD